DRRAARASRRHRDGPHRRTGVFMAAVSKNVTVRVPQRTPRTQRTSVALVSLALLLNLTFVPDPRAQTAPQHIISLVPATTEMLFAMGAGDRIAGVSNYDRFPPEVSRLPRVGGLLDPDVERLLSLKPGLVIVYETQVELKRQLERAQIPMFNYLHRGL